jgi:hypothetical protein
VPNRAGQLIVSCSCQHIVPGWQPKHGTRLVSCRHWHYMNRARVVPKHYGPCLVLAHLARPVWPSIMACPDRQMHTRDQMERIDNDMAAPASPRDLFCLVKNQTCCFADRLFCCRFAVAQGTCPSASHGCGLSGPRTVRP